MGIYGPKLGEHMVARSALSRSVVKTVAAEEIPRGLLWRSSPGVWHTLTAESQQLLEKEALEWARRLANAVVYFVPSGHCSSLYPPAPTRHSEGGWRKAVSVEGEALL